MHRIRAPLSIEPDLARMFGIQVVFDLEPELPRKVLRSVADEQVMVRTLHHCLCAQRRGADAFERRHTAGAFRRAMHAARIELNDSIRVRQSSVPDAVVLGVQLDQVDDSARRATRL